MWLTVVDLDACRGGGPRCSGDVEAEAGAALADGAVGCRRVAGPGHGGRRCGRVNSGGDAGAGVGDGEFGVGDGRGRRSRRLRPGLENWTALRMRLSATMRRRPGSPRTMGSAAAGC